MPLSRRLLFGLACWASSLASVWAAEKWFLIGDSLTKEYALEFPLLHPSNPAAWGERNWIELLAKHRSEQVDIGSLAFWPDSRLTGHEYNWAFPGSTSAEWKEILTANDPLRDLEYLLLRVPFDVHLREEADRVVIFLGGNDLKNRYSPYYEGADPEPFIAELVDNIRVIVDYVRRRNELVPIVIAGMPDVGITPTVQESKPDPEKRQRNTDLTVETNRRLRRLARDKRIGFADIGALAAELSGPRRFVVGGIRFLKEVDPESLSNRPEYLFSPDGFHPNTMAHFLFANAIVQAFNETYPDLPPVPPFRTEEMLTRLGLDPDVSLADWAEAYGVEAPDGNQDDDGDSWPLVAEFALGLDPRVAEPERGPRGRVSRDRVEVEYELRVSASAHVQVVPQSSLDLVAWAPVPEDQRALVEGFRSRAWIETTVVDPVFLRLAFQLTP